MNMYLFYGEVRRKRQWVNTSTHPKATAKCIVNDTPWPIVVNCWKSRWYYLIHILKLENQNWTKPVMREKSFILINMIQHYELWQESYASFTVLARFSPKWHILFGGLQKIQLRTKPGFLYCISKLCPDEG
jgi:hypothetical protein